MRRITALLCPLLIAGHALLAQTSPTASAIVKGDLGAALDQYMTRTSAYGMSGAVLVAKDGEVILHKGYGLADRSTGRTITPETAFLIGSLGKQFTASAILRLEMEGTLTTNDTLGRFFPDAPADKSGITLHQLLTHTSGLPYFPGSSFFEQVTREQAMKEMLSLTLAVPPGTQHIYSNPGYTLLAGVIERASGETFESYLTNHLFIPAGMKNTGFERDTTRWNRETSVHSYSGANDEGSLIDFPYSPKAVGAGTVVSTVGDLYRWEKALQGNTILSDAAKQKLFTPHVNMSGTQSYGYGWNIIRTIRNTRLITHAGDIGGYNADFRRYIDEGLVIIFASNSRVNGAGYRQAVMNNLSLIVAGARHAAPPAIVEMSPEQLTRYTGVYELPTGGRLQAWMENGRLMMGAEGQDAISLLAGAEAKDTAIQNQLNAQAKLVAEGLSRRDIEPLRASLHPSIPFEGSSDGFLQTWTRYTDSLGAFKRFEPLGTAVLGPNAAQTFFRLHFDRGSVVSMYGWGGGKLADVAENVERPLATIVAPDSETSVASFDPFSGRSVRVSFAQTARGATAGLTVHGRNGNVEARRRS